MKIRVFLTRLFLLLFILSLAVPQTFAQKKSGKKPFTVVIDPGHGGVDPGALGRRTKEKDVNMSVSKQLASMINSEYPEVKVIFTRTTDVLNVRTSQTRPMQTSLFRFTQMLRNQKPPTAVKRLLSVQEAALKQRLPPCMRMRLSFQKTISKNFTKGSTPVQARAI